MDDFKKSAIVKEESETITLFIDDQSLQLNEEAGFNESSQ